MLGDRDIDGRTGEQRRDRERELPCQHVLLPVFRSAVAAGRREADQRAFLRDCSSSYLNETLSLVRNATALPFSITKSCSTTSATRRSRSVREARVIATIAASSHDLVLVPISSRTL